MQPEKGAQAPPEMLHVLFFSLAVFTVLFVYLLARRLELEHKRHTLETTAA